MPTKKGIAKTPKILLIGLLFFFLPLQGFAGSAKKECLKLKYKVKRYSEWSQKFNALIDKEEAFYKKKFPTTLEGWNEYRKAENNLKKEFEYSNDELKTMARSTHLSANLNLLLHLGVNRKEIIERYKYNTGGDPAGKYYLKAKKKLANKNINSIIEAEPNKPWKENWAWIHNRRIDVHEFCKELYGIEVLDWVPPRRI